MKFSHPLTFGIAKTCYSYYPAQLTIAGTAEFLLDFKEHVPPKYLYLLADDSCQFNKVVPPNGIGVTAWLNVKFHSLPTTNKVEIKSQILKQAFGQNGRRKTWIQGSIFSRDQIYVTYSSLFVESPLINNIKFQVGTVHEQKFKIVREQTMTQDASNVDAFYTRDENKIIWHNGYGPKNHVHGGVISFPIFDHCKVSPKTMFIQYKKAIPLLSTSVLHMSDNTFQIVDANDLVQAHARLDY